MKRTIVTFLLFATANFTFAQQKYYAFSINGKQGITDTLGNEAMKPTYAFATLVPAKNQIYLQDFSEKPDIIFNTKTGAKQLYESVYDNKVQIKNVSYSIVSNKGKSYLLSEETDKTIPITRDYDKFNTVGQYIIAEYSLQDPLVDGGKDKNGRFLPPKIREMRNYHVVLANDESLKTIVDKGFDKYLPLYKIPEEKKDDGIVRLETIIPQPKKTSPNFDYIVLSKGNNHRLFNEKMVLVKTFVLAKADDDMLLDFCKKALKLNLNTTPSDDYGAVISAPPVALGSGRPRNPTPEVIEKKPFVPFFYVKKLDNGNTVFALQETEEISKRIFEAKPTLEVRLFERLNLITIRIDGKEDSRFSYNPKTGEIYLPKVYLAGLGITVF